MGSERTEARVFTFSRQLNSKARFVRSIRIWDHEQKLGYPGEAAARGGGPYCLGRAQERRALPGQHDRVRG